MSNPHHLAVNVLRLLAIIERCPTQYNRSSLQRLKEQIDALHRMKLSLTPLTEELDLESVDRRVDAAIKLEKASNLEKLQGDVPSLTFESHPRSSDHLLSSHTAVTVSAMPGNDEDDMRLALLTPKGALCRKKPHVKINSALNGKSVSMQVLRIESISKMNKQLLHGMQDIRNSAIKVERYMHTPNLTLLFALFL